MDGSAHALAKFGNPPLGGRPTSLSRDLYPSAERGQPQYDMFSELHRMPVWHGLHFGGA